MKKLYATMSVIVMTSVLGMASPELNNSNDQNNLSPVWNINIEDDNEEGSPIELLITENDDEISSKSDVDLSDDEKGSPILSLRDDDDDVIFDSPVLNVRTNRKVGTPTQRRSPNLLQKVNQDNDNLLAQNEAPKLEIVQNDDRDDDDIYSHSDNENSSSSSNVNNDAAANQEESENSLSDIVFSSFSDLDNNDNDSASSIQDNSPRSNNELSKDTASQLSNAELNVYPDCIQKIFLDIAKENAPRPKLPLYQKNIENSVSFQDSDTSSDIAFGVLFQDDNRSSDGPVNIVKKSEEDK